MNAEMAERLQPATTGPVYVSQAGRKFTLYAALRTKDRARKVVWECRHEHQRDSEARKYALAVLLQIARW